MEKPEEKKNVAGGSVESTDLFGWVSRDERMPVSEDGRRVLAFSPTYPKGHEMRHRMMDPQFFRICGEATHWLSVERIEPNAKWSEPDQ